MKQIFHCIRSAPFYSLPLAQAHAGHEIASLSYSLPLAQAHAGREIAPLSYSLPLAQAHAGREIASLSYSLPLAQAHAGREIASLSYPIGEPAHKLILNLKLANLGWAPCLYCVRQAGLKGGGGSVSVLF